jgi:phosphoribosylformylglycinamidine synthase
MAEPLHRQLGMTDDELAAVVDELGREPTHLELAMYSVMWSEHCSYKSSRAYSRRFPTEAPWVLVGPARARAWSTSVMARDRDPYRESQPSLGGRALSRRRDRSRRHHPRHLLDGRAPIALMDPLRFGTLDDARTRYLFEGVCRESAATGIR